MGLFRWWHTNMRSLVKPKTETVAKKWYTNLSFLYAFLAWNAVGFGLYGLNHATEKKLSFEERSDLSLAEKIAQKKGLTNAKIIHVNDWF